MRLVSGVVNRCAHECQLKMLGLSTCSVYLAKRRHVFKVLHSLKVFSTKRTAWIWRTGILVPTDRQTDRQQ